MQISCARIVLTLSHDKLPFERFTSVRFRFSGLGIFNRFYEDLSLGQLIQLNLSLFSGERGSNSVSTDVTRCGLDSRKQVDGFD